MAERVRFGPWLLFAALWVTLVYAPIAHWVWGGGIFGATGIVGSKISALDFAGGTVVHMNAGIAGLMLAVVLGKRLGFMKDPNIRPHNLPFVMLGAGLLWFGWFGFNAGSELAADATAGLAWTNTLLATSAALLGWLLIERIRDGHATSLGAASGAVAGLVAVTPACGFVDPIGAIAIGVVAGAVCALAVGLKFKIGWMTPLMWWPCTLLAASGERCRWDSLPCPPPRPRAACFSAEVSPSSGRSCSPRSSSRSGAA
ncbi:probable ammonia channel [Arthrobacter sp. Hiyo6]|nr:probable ammonia channel [Arthrobacter sp. Hiyo6]